MATRGPQSILDRREVDNTAHVVRDRVTRQRSPARSPKRSYSNEDVDHVSSRISQPYRTSFSAVLPPTRSKCDRSRSTSPSCSSLKGSDRSRSKSPGRRSHPKRVTYDNRVVIRESGTSDSLITNLSDRELNNTSGHYSANSSMFSPDSSVMSGNSSRDYSTELRELSQQIVKEYSQPSEREANNSQVKSSQNQIPKQRSSTPNGSMKSNTGEQRQAGTQRSNGQQKSHENHPRSKENPPRSYEHHSRSYEDRPRSKENPPRSYEHHPIMSYENHPRPKENPPRLYEHHQRSYENHRRSHEPRQNGYPRSPESHKLYSDHEVEPKMVVHEDYDHDRSVSYRVAIKNKYSKEIRQKAEALVEEQAPAMEVPSPGSRYTTSEQRHNSMSLDDDGSYQESNRLTPAKRGISASIGNFFRRHKKGNLSNASSVIITPSEEMDTTPNRRSSFGSLSRSKFRRSMTRLFGGGKSKKGSKSPRKENSSFEDRHDGRTNTENTKPSPVSSVYMKSIEQASKNDKDVYHKFKDKRSVKPGKTNAPVKPEVTVRVTSLEPDVSPKYGKMKAAASEELYPYTPGGKAEPPDSLDVRFVPKSIRSLQALQISTISGDDSIGDCSIDANLTGSEPSLLSETSASKQVVTSETSRDAEIVPAHSPVTNSKQNVDIVVNSDHNTPKCRKPSHELLPDIADSAPFFPEETTRTPSYLRISSAVSGYGHYSRYSAYKGIEKRSPYSSSLSLRSSRSDLTPISADMPIGKIPNIQAPTNYPPLRTNFISQNGQNGVDSVDSGHEKLTNGTAVDDAFTPHVNGDTNGHIGHVGNLVLTGDNFKDTDDFLNVTQSEEIRMSALCSQCEAELAQESLSEEVSGKLRSAVGKANLLINQKFNQFRDLCHQHKHPELGEKATKWEDLQGFWEMVKIQVDDCDEVFTEIDLMRQNGWREIKIQSRRSSTSSSPKSGSLSVSNSSTPSHTPGSRRKALQQTRDTPDSSPERSQKAKATARAREEARKRMLAEKRAAMKQQKQADEIVEIYVPDTIKSNSPARTSDTEV